LWECYEIHCTPGKQSELEGVITLNHDSLRHCSVQVIDYIRAKVRGALQVHRGGDSMAASDVTRFEQEQVPAQFSRGWPINPQGHTVPALLAEVEDALRYDVSGLTQEGEAHV
jgi:hypothetical protein